MGHSLRPRTETESNTARLVRILDEAGCRAFLTGLPPEVALFVEQLRRDGRSSAWIVRATDNDGEIAKQATREGVARFQQDLRGLLSGAFLSGARPAYPPAPARQLVSIIRSRADTQIASWESDEAAALQQMGPLFLEDATTAERDASDKRGSTRGAEAAAAEFAAKNPGWGQDRLFTEYRRQKLCPPVPRKLFPIQAGRGRKPRG
jgi:hypothetical protein